jgi:hypothetical protein
VALNENLKVDANETVRRAFRGRPEKVLLRIRLRLYKWTNRPLVVGPCISPWWSFVDTLTFPGGIRVEGYRTAQERARRLGTTVRGLARSRAAISDEFGNTMTELVVIRLNVDAWALVGQASGQPEFAKEHSDLQHVFLIGGADQAWIPNLTPACVQQIPAQGLS